MSNTVALLTGLGQNVTLLLSLTLLASFIKPLWQQMRPGVPSAGVLFGGIACVGMLASVQVAPGVLLDGRVMIVALAGAFGGTGSAVVAATLVSAYRLWLGGAGVLPGVGAVLTGAVLGVWWQRRWGSEGRIVTCGVFFRLGMVLAVQTWLWALALPAALVWPALQVLAFPLGLLYPLGTILLGLLIAHALHYYETEEALLKSEERFCSLIEGSVHGVLIHRDFTPLFVNQPCAELFGYTPDEILGMDTVLTLAAPHERARWLQYKNARLRGESAPTRYEYEGLRKDGSLIWLENTVRVIDWKGEAAILSANFQITARKRAEAALKEARDKLEIQVAERTAALQCANAALHTKITERRRSEEKFRRLLEAAPDAMVIVDQDGEIVLINARAETLFGYAPEEVLGERVEKLMPARYRKRHYDHQRAYLAQPSVRLMGRGLDLYGLHKDGREFPVEISLSPIEMEEGALILSAIRDVTERKQTEKVLTRQAQALARSNAELEQFASVASHDLQEPLRKIQVFSDRLDVICGTALSAQGRDYLTRMRRAAQRMQMQIQDLLAFARVTTQARPFVPVNLSTMVHEIVDDFAVRIEETSGSVHVGPLPTLEADPMQMRQLFHNLIGNALKFHRPDVPPRVSVQGSLLAEPASGVPDRGQWQILVQDNGIGFDEKYCDRIFILFQRLHGRSAYEGTGVGLALCQKIVTRHGGHIVARSMPGQGTTFIVTLPSTHPQAANVRYKKT